MAKKAVATLQTGNSGRAHSKCIKMVKSATLQTGNSGRAHSKCIKMVKSPKTGAYIFQEEIVLNEKVNEFFK